MEVFAIPLKKSHTVLKKRKPPIFISIFLFQAFEEVGAEEAGAGEGLLVFPVVDFGGVA